MTPPTQPLHDALSALADMWNQYCPPPIGHAYMSSGEYAEDVLTAAGLMGADGVAAFPPEPPATRPLSSLTDAEAADVYRLAFGSVETPMDNVVVEIVKFSDWIALMDKMTPHDNYKLWIWSDGRIKPYYTQDRTWDKPASFNAVAVVRFLESLGIALG